VWDVWTLLEWGYDKTYIRFRVGEFINRLSNDDAVHEIRAFDATARIELISFFEHLIQSYEPDETVKRTYTSIIALLGGGSRLIGCPYQEGRALNVDCRGQFAVCAPKGQPHALGADAETAVRAADAERRSIVSRHCAGCIHDYHDDWTPTVAESRHSATAALRRLESPLVTPTSLRPASPVASPNRVLVLGWYGTETIGDQAILAGLIDEYRRKTPDATFIVPSQYPFYTRVNIERLGLDCRVTSYGDDELTGDLWGCGTVMIGGGPLMDIPQLGWLATIVEHARASGRRTIVEGCGIGPVHLPETGAYIGRIARAANEIRLRDRASAKRLRALGYEGHVTVIDDPAARWVRSQSIRHYGSGAGPICLSARELTHEYPQATSPADATHAIAALLARVSDWFPGRALRLHAMHHFPVGGDDRIYARRLARLVGNGRCLVDNTPRTPTETLSIMAEASLVIAMRFHSVVFAHTIGAPMVAIDYTDGGKVTDYLSEHDLAERRLTFADLARIGRQDLIQRGLGMETARP
jgi:polysaccharide pyruvyl transferase WcaK-like protein